MPPKNCENMIDDIKKTLWSTADKLRANMDAAEYKYFVLAFVFLKYFSGSFHEICCIGERESAIVSISSLRDTLLSNLLSCKISILETKKLLESAV